MALRCGTAVRDITPAYPTYLHGYADRDRPAEGVAEPICLGCLGCLVLQRLADWPPAGDASPTR